jgi:hypothetical protein
VSGLEILAVVAVIGFTIYQQVKGQHLRGKKVVLLPAILTVIGFTDLRSGSSGHSLQAADILCIAIGAAGSVLIGLGFGAITRLESRGGALWAQMPVWGLWLWGAMVAWRGVDFVLATAMHAHVAASSSTLLFTLGLNRLAQAAVIVPRAMAAGVPFAPEQDGKVFMADAFNRGRTGPSWVPLERDEPRGYRNQDYGYGNDRDYGRDSDRDRDRDYDRSDWRQTGSGDGRDKYAATFDPWDRS